MNPRLLDLVTVAAAFAICAAAYPLLIRALRRRRLGQVIQAELPEAHQRKAGTPTGGGILFTALAVAGGLLAWRAGHPGPLPAVVALAAFGLLGLADDLAKLRVGSLGIPARAKLPVQFLLAIPVAWAAGAGGGWHQHLLPDLGPWYWPLAVLVVVAASNAVNLTDGIDGLAGGLSAIAVLALAGALPGASAGERAVAMTLVGGLLAFLVFNRFPARVFMGDTGALGIGAALAAMALQQGWAILLPLVALVFVLETLSVIIQVACFKATGGRRVFKMAPIHHTFHLEGWSENRIALTFWSVGAISALLSTWVGRTAA